MAKKDIKSLTIPLAIKQMPIKTTIFLLPLLSEWIIFLTVIKLNADEDAYKPGYSYIAGGMQTGTVGLKNSLAIS